MSEILERRLLVGLDLCDDYTQISCYNEKTFEPECLGVDDQEEGQFIPTVMAVRNDTKEWLFGREALWLWPFGYNLAKALLKQSFL